MKFSINVKDKMTDARTGEIELFHGKVKTPVFMPVATRGAIRAMPMDYIEDIGFEIILSNTYHMYLKPGLQVLEESGGIHGFMNYKRPVLTDSGGFQVFSLSNLCKVRENGVEFASHLDGSRHMFTPSKVLDIQKVIGSDIMMVLDQCDAYPTEKKKAYYSMKRTLQWAKESIDHYKLNFDSDRQSIFGIVQGSTYMDLRKECADELTAMPFSGYAIGGLSVGEPKEIYKEITNETLCHLPEDKPRYMMGVGSPMEILFAISRGVDMFDCVMPTRIARNGTLFTTKGRINIRNSSYEKDLSPLDPDCGCFVCRKYTRAYLRHIFKMNEIAALIYNTYHNLYFMKYFLDEIRAGIENGSFMDLYKKYEAVY